METLIALAIFAVVAAARAWATFAYVEMLESQPEKLRAKLRQALASGS